MFARLFPAAALVAAFLLLPLSALAQEVEPPPNNRASPLMMARTTIGNGTTLLVTYGSPRRNERAIFGGLVPFGEVWRLGANEATHFITTGTVNVAGERLSPGAYTLFAVPNEDSWQLIINRQTGQWGTQYNERADLARVTLPARRADKAYEALMMGFEETPGGTDLHIMWDQTHVVVPITRVYTAPADRPSPTAIAQKQFDNGTYAKITYSAPRTRGREIFGGLVPFGEEWRLGANEATELTVTGDVMLGGQSLDAGTYALFAVPHAQHWDLVVSRETGLWGNYGRETSMDVATIRMPIERSGEAFDALTIAFQDVEDATHLVIGWDDTKVRVPIAPR